MSSPQGVPGARADYAAGASPVFAAQADLNGDGKPDLVVVNAGAGSISILPGSAGGTFTQAQGLSVGANANPSSVAVADFNADGLPDIAVANTGANNITVFLASAQGGFNGGVDLDAGGGPVSVAASDFNGDGAIDLVVTDDTDGGISILAGNGDGTFQRAVFLSTGMNPRSVVVADFNADEKPDLAVANSNAMGTGSGNVALLLGNGDGTFSTPVTYAAGNDPVFLIATDLNGDGIPDITAASLNDGSISVLLANADGSLKPLRTYVVPGANGLTSGDFNGDGKPDLAVSGAANQVTILAGYGNGTFHPAGSSTVDTGPVFLLAGDFNGDGRADLATVNKTGADVSVLLGAAPGSITTVASSLNPSVYGQPVSFTATVSPTSATGRVTFYDGVSVLGSAPLTSGQAAVASASLNAGPHNITALYSGDVSHPLSSSGGLAQAVNALPANGFQPPLTFQGGSNPRAIAAADFNGDGLVDIAVANDFSSGNNTINILLGTGNGFFAAPVA